MVFSVENIANNKIMRTFVVLYITSEWVTASNRADFLYPFNNIIGYNTPSWTLNGATAPSECTAEGKVVPFLFLQPQHVILSVMLYTKKNCASVNNSIRQATLNGAKSVSIQAFNIEMNAKNEAYAFILQSNLYHEFVAFCRNNRGQDIHSLCINTLKQKSL